MFTDVDHRIGDWCFLSFVFLLNRMMSDYSVEPINDGISELKVEFHGPKDSNFPASLCHCSFVQIETWTTDTQLENMASQYLLTLW